MNIDQYSNSSTDLYPDASDSNLINNQVYSNKVIHKLAEIKANKFNKLHKALMNSNSRYNKNKN